MPRVLPDIHNGELRGYIIACPGCGMHHAFYTELAMTNGARWTFNGDLERPTFSPSMLCWWEEGEERAPRRCHSFVRDGRIEYLDDCTHAMKGQTVDLPEFD